jgi:hypothetical protein
MTFDEVTGAWNLAVVQPLLRGGGDYCALALVLARTKMRLPPRWTPSSWPATRCSP